VVKLALVALLLLSAYGCGPVPDYPMEKTARKESEVESGRFVVQRVGVIADDLAYGERRGIYVIRDQQTGKEYVGLSGVGIAEIGSHTQQVGKTTSTVSDER